MEFRIRPEGDSDLAVEMQTPLAKRLNDFFKMTFFSIARLCQNVYNTTDLGVYYVLC